MLRKPDILHLIYNAFNIRQVKKGGPSTKTPHKKQPSRSQDVTYAAVKSGFYTKASILQIAWILLGH